MAAIPPQQQQQPPVQVVQVQQSSVPGQVIHVQQQPMPKSATPYTPAVQLSILRYGKTQMSVGIVCIIIGVLNICVGYSVAANGIWIGLIYLATGILGMVAGNRQVPGGVLGGFFGMSIVSTVFAFIMFVVTIIGIALSVGYSKSYYSRNVTRGIVGIVLNLVLLGMSITEFIVAIFSSVISSSHVNCSCCMPQQERATPQTIVYGHPQQQQFQQPMQQYPPHPAQYQQPAPAGYQQQPAPGGYQQQPVPVGYQQQQPAPAGYQQQPAPVGYQQQPAPAGYPEKPGSMAYPPQATAPYQPPINQNPPPYQQEPTKQAPP